MLVLKKYLNINLLAAVGLEYKIHLDKGTSHGSEIFEQIFSFISPRAALV